mmetsp:Transcript_18012/g.41733  ORF Transcript_18012/g.41733 Transcript_18012/m.41733 type:complete len:318 (+) Transcript_18012:361-1314(+)
MEDQQDGMARKGEPEGVGACSGTCPFIVDDAEKRTHCRSAHGEQATDGGSYASADACASAAGATQGSTTRASQGSGVDGVSTERVPQIEQGGAGDRGSEARCERGQSVVASRDRDSDKGEERNESRFDSANRGCRNDKQPDSRGRGRDNDGARNDAKQGQRLRGRCTVAMEEEPAARPSGPGPDRSSRLLESTAMYPVGEHLGGSPSSSRAHSTSTVLAGGGRRVAGAQLDPRWLSRGGETVWASTLERKLTHATRGDIMQQIGHTCALQELESLAMTSTAGELGKGRKHSCVCDVAVMCVCQQNRQVGAGRVPLSD